MFMALLQPMIPGDLDRFMRDIAADPAIRAQITPYTESLLAAFEAHVLPAQHELDHYSRRASDTLRFEALFETHDLLLCPTFGDVAPPVTEGFGPLIPTSIWAAATLWMNEFGLPAASVPCGFVDGLPVALQIIGPRGRSTGHPGCPRNRGAMAMGTAFLVGATRATSER